MFAVGFYVVMLLVFINLLQEIHKIRELTGSQYYSDFSYCIKFILTIVYFILIVVDIVINVHFKF